MSDAEIFVNTESVEGLELLSALPPKDAPRRNLPLLFLHGAFAGAWMWKDNFLPWFARQGYASYALSVSGHGKSLSNKELNYLSIADYVEDVEICVNELMARGLPTPVLVGHSMGGFVAQKYLERHPVPAVVFLCAVPPQGLLLSQLHIMSSRPDLILELNQVISGGDIKLSTVRDALFAQPVDTEILKRFRANMSLESLRAIWDMSLFNLPLLPPWQRPPILVIGAEKDLLVPAFLVEATARTYSLDAHIFPDMGHALTHEKSWESVVETVANWLDELAL